MKLDVKFEKFWVGFARLLNKSTIVRKCMVINSIKSQSAFDTSVCGLETIRLI